MESLGCSNKVIVTVGKVGSGKSTVLNNLYGLNLVAKSSSRPVTTIISEHHVQNDREPFVVLDTPGLGSISRSTESIIGEVANFVKGKDFTLLYCLPVKPSDTLTESDISTIKTIDSLLGRRVWDKCVLLLTFSDVAIEEFGSQEEAQCYSSLFRSHVDGYTSYLLSHVDAFYEQFIKCGIVLPQIIMVSNYEAPRNRLQRESIGQIVAVPVKKDTEGGLRIIPGVNIQGDLNWVERAGQVIADISRLTKRKKPSNWHDVVLQYPWQIVTGTLVGAGLGGIFGSVVGLIGVFIGGIMGLVLAFALIKLSKLFKASHNQNFRS